MVTAAIVVNGNDGVGLGHIYRALEVAKLLEAVVKIYYDRKQTDPAVFGRCPFMLCPYSGKWDLLAQLSRERFCLVINDILDTDAAYMKSLRELPVRPGIVNFEDLGEGSGYADAVINALYDGRDHAANMFCGADYYLLPRKFLGHETIRIKEKVERVFVCFGGADPQGYTEKVLEIACEERFCHVDFYFAVGRAKKNYQELLRYNGRANICVRYDVADMPGVMSGCDIAITSRGRTCFELASLGIPAISMAQNEREERHGFPSEANGFVYLGRDVDKPSIRRALARLADMPGEGRLEMQKKQIRHNLKEGRTRIREVIDSVAGNEKNN